ncbi:hypothetical protein [Caudoviricetes sp.]|nr:hypothetical protein [Caudoviricetes sp.]
MENIISSLSELSNVLHFLGKYREANVMAALLRYCRLHNITTLEELENKLDVVV